MITYKLYELTKSKYPTIGETKEIIKNEPTKPILEIIKENADIELTYISDIPNDRIEDELYIISLLVESDNYTKKNCVVVKFEDDIYAGCEGVYYAYTQFLDCANHDSRTICDYYFGRK